jgi:hypothetical protein
MAMIRGLVLFVELTGIGAQERVQTGDEFVLRIERVVFKG